MKSTNKSVIAEVLQKYEKDLLAEWVKQQLSADTARPDLLNESGLREQSAKVLRLLRAAVQHGSMEDDSSQGWDNLKVSLAEMSRARGERGFSPSETAWFVLSLKRPLFSSLRREIPEDVQQLGDETWDATALLDRLALYCLEAYQASREQVIKRMGEEILELSTPVVQLWDGILAVPMVGTLDSARTQLVMESLLEAIVQTGSSVAIIDITGVPAVDTQVAQHLLKTVAAARLMGAECAISGIRPNIAQTLVTLGVSFDVVTKPRLYDALAWGLRQLGLRVVKTEGTAQA